MGIDRLRLSIRVCSVALILGGLLGWTMAPSSASKTRMGSTMRITVKNDAHKTIWLTPYGASTFSKFSIVSAHLTCLGPGKSKTMDLYFPGTGVVNAAQVKFQAEPTDKSDCSGAQGHYWSEVCSSHQVDVNLTIAFEQNEEHFSFTPFHGC